MAFPLLFAFLVSVRFASDVHNTHGTDNVRAEMCPRAVIKIETNPMHCEWTDDTDHWTARAEGRGREGGRVRSVKKQNRIKSR